ncbi:MAG: TadG family pilus assembly protein [Pirellulales bacterium]
MKIIQEPESGRRGVVLLLTLFLLVAMLAITALALDLGYVMVAQTELQRTADATAMAAAWDLIDEEMVKSNGDPSIRLESIRDTATHYAAANYVCGDSPDIDQNADNVTTGGVVVGYLDLDDPDAELSTEDPETYNAVQVRVERVSTLNGEVPFFFARALGYSSIAKNATAVAAIQSNFGGFGTPSDGGNLGILPFALDETTWDGLLAGVGSDNYTWNASTESVTSGCDDVLEVNLYPQGTGSPGNRGTIDIGGSNNSTADIARQITDGVTPDDLAHHGGKLEFNDDGELFLNGDTGISAGVKDELGSIVGEPRIIPIFRTVCGPGNNATYTIVKFAGVRIMYVKLTGSMSSKKVIIQPANVKVKGGIPSSGPQTSWHIYSPVMLVR